MKLDPSNDNARNTAKLQIHMLNLVSIVLTKTRKNSSKGESIRLRPVFDFIEDLSITLKLDQ